MITDRNHGNTIFFL